MWVQYDHLVERVDSNDVAVPALNYTVVKIGKSTIGRKSINSIVHEITNIFFSNV